jgi:enoyl-CoA hydratase
MSEGRIAASAGPVVSLTISRPEKRNSLTPAMLSELRDAVARLREDRAVRVVLLRGEGGVFCAGADLAVLGSLDPASARGLAETGQQVCTALEALPFPVLAAVDGPCVGGGLELALACDIILASDRAVFRAPEVGYGFIPGWGGSLRLPRRVGLGRAKEILLTSRAVGAAEAHAVGLADRLYPAGDFAAGVDAFAQEMAARAPLALALAKDVIQRGMEASLETGLALEREAFALVFTSEDSREGVRAFLEKRPPRFTGR